MASKTKSRSARKTRWSKPTKGEGARGDDDKVVSRVPEPPVRSIDKIMSRVPEPPVLPEAETPETEYPLAPAGSRYARTGYKDQGWCPEHWDEGVMIYPPGSAQVLEDPGDRFTKEQWDIVVKMLDAGFVVGFSIHEGEEADLACNLSRRCQWPIRAVYDDYYGDQVYFVRDGDRMRK